MNENAHVPHHLYEDTPAYVYGRACKRVLLWLFFLGALQVGMTASAEEDPQGAFPPFAVGIRPSDVEAGGVVLPNGQPFSFWENGTEWTRTWYVDRKHPDADDQNDGSREKPLRTLAAAAQRVEPGQRVCVFPGVYSEPLKPIRGGTSAENMIGFYALEPGKTVLSGWLDLQSIERPWLRPEWKRVEDSPHWELPLHGAWFPEENLFARPRMDQDAFFRMPWARRMREHPEVLLSRGMVKQGSRRLREVPNGTETLEPGTFKVIHHGETLVLRTFGDVPPADTGIQLCVRS